MMAFFDYDVHHLKVENPYHFLGRLLNKLKLSLDGDPLNEAEDNIFETFDSIYIELLVKSWIVKQGDYFYINPYNDEKMIEAYNGTK